MPGRFSVSPAVVLDFLRRTLPFSELDYGVLEDFARRWIIDFYPKGTVIVREAATELTHFHLIQKGGVKIYHQATDSLPVLKDVGGEGQSFGAQAIALDQPAEFTVETLEDTYCFLLDKEDFRSLINEYPRVAEYYLSNLSEDLLYAAYSELRSERVRARSQESLYLVNSQVLNVIRNPLNVISGAVSVRQAASKMAALRVGSLLVSDRSGEIVGIVTDKDLRTKVVAKGLSHTAQVAGIMDSPVHCVEAHAFCFDAMLTMVREQVEHLAVKLKDQIVGVVSANDIMVFQASPLFLFREAKAQRKVEGLYDLHRRIPLMVRTLIEQGAKPSNITRMVTLVNDSTLTRLLTLLQDELGAPPVPFCWVTLGSEGRKEQIFTTDLDSAIVFQDGTGPWEHRSSEFYFDSFARRAVEHLQLCGYQRSKSEIIASNPRWNRPYAVWAGYFNEWIASPEPAEVSRAALFFDFRPAYGDRGLGQDLRHSVVEQAQRQHNFLRQLAADCLLQRPPISFFRNMIVEKNGDRKNRLDLRTRGLRPIVDFVRLMALRNGIEETNTLERIAILEQMGRIKKEFCVDLAEAFELQIQLLLVRQLESVEEGRPPDSFIDAGELSDLEKRALKDVFAVLDRMLGLVKNEFPGVV